MSKKSKSRDRVERRAAKARRHASNTLKYLAWRDAGTNSKRQKANRRNLASPIKHQHVIPMCGNPGCKRCFPLLE